MSGRKCYFGLDDTENIHKFKDTKEEYLNFERTMLRIVARYGKGTPRLDVVRGFRPCSVSIYSELGTEIPEQVKREDINNSNIKQILVDTETKELLTIYINSCVSRQSDKESCNRCPFQIEGNKDSLYKTLGPYSDSINEANKLLKGLENELESKVEHNGGL